jgi:hypothetical protein
MLNALIMHNKIISSGVVVVSRKFFIITSIVLLLMLLSACGNNTDNSPSGSTADNATTTQEHKEIETLFYDMGANQGLLKINSDGTGQEHVLGADKGNDENRQYMQAIIRNGWIYYICYHDDCYHDDDYNIWKTKTNEAQALKISDDNVSSFEVKGEWIYFVDRNDWNIYKMKTDGSEKRRLHDKKVNRLKLDGDYVYFIEEDNLKLCRVNTEGNNPEYLVDDAGSFAVCGNHLMYQPFHSSDRSLYIMDIRSPENKAICSNSAHRYEVTDKRYVYLDEKSDLHVADIDGKNDTIIANKVSSIRIMNDKLYCKSIPEEFTTDEVFYTINYDGTGKTQFPVVHVDGDDFGLQVDIID